MTAVTAVEIPEIANTSYIAQSLNDLHLMNLRFILRPLNTIQLGKDLQKGSKWRAAILEALQSLWDKVCLYWRNPPDCSICDVKYNCFYYMHFISERAHPYLIKPCFDLKSVYHKSENFSLDFILIGEAIDYRERFVEIIDVVGRVGIGTGRGKFFIDDIKCDSLLNLGTFFSNGSKPINELTLELLTPLKLKEGRKLVYKNGTRRKVYFNKKEISFELFYKFLINRITNLNNLYSNGMSFEKKRIEENKQNMRLQAEQIKMRFSSEWKDFNRYENKSDDKIGGHIGLVKIYGEIAPFIPFLRIGELIGLGSDTTIGFGRYKIIGLGNIRN